MKKNNKKMSGGKIAAGVAAVGAAAAGAYYLLGPKAKEHQKKASLLFSKMKKEVQSEVKKAKDVTTPFYNKAVDIVSKNYAKQYDMHEKEIKDFAKKLKTEWQGIEKVAKKTVKTFKKKAA